MLWLLQILKSWQKRYPFSGIPVFFSPAQTYGCKLYSYLTEMGGVHLGDGEIPLPLLPLLPSVYYWAST